MEGSRTSERRAYADGLPCISDSSYRLVRQQNVPLIIGSRGRGANRGSSILVSVLPCILVLPQLRVAGIRSLGRETSQS